MTDDLKSLADELLRGMGLAVSEHQGDCSTSPTGERYNSIDGLGVREEGVPRSPDTVSASREAAVTGYLGALKEHAAGRRGTVYWRHRPTVEPHYHGWAVYSRLLISDKPVLEAEQTYDASMRATA